MYTHYTITDPLLTEFIVIHDVHIIMIVLSTVTVAIHNVHTMYNIIYILLQIHCKLSSHSRCSHTQIHIRSTVKYNII